MNTTKPGSSGLGLTVALIILALAIFFPLFTLGGLGAFDFWWWMSANAALMTGLVIRFDPGWRAEFAADVRSRLWLKTGAGLLSAVLLYGIFRVGNSLSRELIAVAGEGIEAVYDFKRGASLFRVSLLIVLLIGPAEEFFWRGFVQRRLAMRFGKWFGLCLATFFYTVMHVGSGNPMLILAALVCGIFWGLTYMRFRSLTLNVVSHVVWDVSVFLIFPFS